MLVFFFFSSRRRHTRFDCDWSSDVCSSDLGRRHPPPSLPAGPLRAPDQLQGGLPHRVHGGRRLREVDEVAARLDRAHAGQARSEEHTSELQSQSNLVCRLLLEKKKKREEWSSPTMVPGKTPALSA